MRGELDVVGPAVGLSVGLGLICCGGAASAGDSDYVDVELPITAACWDGPSAPRNDVRMIDLAAEVGLSSGERVDVVGVGWDLTVTTFGQSWVSEAAFVMFDADDEPIDFEQVLTIPGLGLDYPGIESISTGGVVYLEDTGRQVMPLGRGVLTMEFFELFDDEPGFIDSLLTGTLTLRVAGVGSAACSEADLAEPFGVIDLADIVAFVTAFAALDDAADFAEPFGTWDLADIVEFVTVFGDGCE